MEVNKAYSTRDVCSRYGISPQTVHKLVKDGKLRAGKAGRDFRFSPEECDRIFLGIERSKAA